MKEVIQMVLLNPPNLKRNLNNKFNPKATISNNLTIKLNISNNNKMTKVFYTTKMLNKGLLQLKIIRKIKPK